MKTKRIRPLVLATGDKQFNYIHRHNKLWYKNHNLFYRNLYDFCWDQTDTGGVFDEDCIMQFQENLGLKYDEYTSIEDCVKTMNTYRKVWRQLYEVDKESGELFESGFILFEDYYSILCGHGELDENVHKTSYEKGIINSYTKHNIKFQSIRGLRKFTRLSKGSKELSNSISKS